MDNFLYGIQYDPTGEIMYSSPDESKVRQTYETITSGDLATGHWSLVCFERMDKFPIRPVVTADQMVFVFGHK